MTAPLVEIEGLQHHYGGQPVLHGLDLCVERGEWYLFLGPNGAGKTTTIRALMGLLRPTAGRIRFDGQDIRRDLQALRRRVGYLPERFQPYPYLTGAEYLAFVGDMHGIRADERSRRTAELLELLELGDARDEPTARYSMGMTRKLGLAAALLTRPALLILDEPTGNLDTRSASLVREVLAGLTAQGSSILMSTHLLGQAGQCHRVGILHEGRLAVEAEMAALHERFPGKTLEEIFLAVTGEVSAELVEGFLAGWREEGS